MEENRKCNAEFRAVIRLPHANFGKMRGVIANMSFTMLLRLRIPKNYICSGLLYGYESWIIRFNMN